MTSEHSSLVLPKSAQCPFCDYLTRKRPFTFIFENELISILVTREQRGKAHLLVITNRHRETLLDVTQEEAAALGIFVQQAAAAIAQEYKPFGISVWQNNGIPANQAINHVHYHVAGTLEEGGTVWGSVPELSLQATEEIASRLTKYFPF